MSSDPKSKDLALFPPGEFSLAGMAGPEEEERNFRRNLLMLRDQFQQSPEIRECLTAATREERKQGILHFQPFAEFAPGGKASLEKALDYLLEELEQMQAAGHGQYLVDETGKAVAPLTKDMVYQTPDFVNEAGQLVRGKQVVNPGFASAVGLARQEQERTQKALQRSNGEFDQAYRHLKDPDSIVQTAREHLEAAGITSGFQGPSEELIVEVGREHYDGILQSPNTGFHRHAIFGALIARKIIDMSHKACEIVGLERKSNSKVRWYEVKARVPARSAAGEASAPTP